MCVKVKNKYAYLFLISCIAIVIRGLFMDYESGDYELFLSQWCGYLERSGGFKGILTVDADYNVIYLYFLALFTYLPFDYLYSIKALSILFDFVMAFAAYFLVNEVMVDSENRERYSLISYGIVLFIPTVILNGSFWAQCDSIYTSFILLSIYFMSKKKYNTCFILYGVALTFKLQAIFFLPVYGIIYLKNREFSIFKFSWIAVSNFILFIPALIIGKPLKSILDAYTTQVGKYSYKTVFGYPNIYNFLPLRSVQLNMPGIIFTMCLLAALMAVVLCTEGKLDDNSIMELGITVVLLVTYFLPEMHDRYGYVAEVLSAIYYVIRRRNGVAVAMINICALITYSMCLFGFAEGYMWVISILQFVPVFIFTRQFTKQRLSRGRRIGALRKETVI